MDSQEPRVPHGGVDDLGECETCEAGLLHRRPCVSDIRLADTLNFTVCLDDHLHIEFRDLNNKPFAETSWNIDTIDSVMVALAGVRRDLLREMMDTKKQS